MAVSFVKTILREEEETMRNERYGKKMEIQVPASLVQMILREQRGRGN